MNVMLAEHPHLKDLNEDQINISADNNDDDDNDRAGIIPEKKPSYFRISKLKGIEDGCIYLEIAPEYVPTVICGDGCSVNLKGSRLLEEIYGLKSPFSRCASHASAGTIRRLCTSENKSQIDAKNLYENLRSLLKHFAMSPKSSELLQNALNTMDMHNIHLLNWGSTRMAGFLDASVQASKIIVPFLDTIIAGNIRPDETKYIASPKGE